MSTGIYGKAPINPNTAEVEGIQKTSATLPTAQPGGEVMLKRILAGAVAFATAGTVTFPPNTIAFKVCFFIVGVGAALGITSRGVGR